MRYKAFEAAQAMKIPNTDLDADTETRLLQGNIVSENTVMGERDTENQIVRVLAIY